MRVVVDTNVVISALLSPSGGPAQVLRLWEAESFELVASEEILAEYARVLNYPKIADRLKLTEESAQELINALRRLAILVEPAESLRIVADDPDDDKFLACALAAGAEYVVSGDEHLLTLGEYRGIQILPPSAFWALLGGH
jgi:putative PIN family toxin of toxin-antitoxin system